MLVRLGLQFGIALLVLLFGSACDREIVIVDTGLGRVVGDRLSSGIERFLGVPFAAPPIGALRWKPPRPPLPWGDRFPSNGPDLDGAFPAFFFGPAAPQTGGSFRQSEDVLTLDIWTPEPDAGRRPVMVYVHGGGWTHEGSFVDWYDGETFARRGDVVLVSVNYRLGPLGFLYLGDVSGPEYAESGNLGLLDQIAALRWVRDNIAAFGGDPDNVTLFGESAGSMSVVSLLTMPRAQGLFHKAIAQSGAANTVRSTTYADSVTRRFMNFAGVNDIEGLRALTTEEILAAEEALENDVWVTDWLYGPVVDGTSLLQPPLAAIAEGSGAEVPLLHGTTRDEARLWLTWLPFLQAIPLSEVVKLFPWIESFLGDSTEDIAADYAMRRPEATPGDITLDAASDFLFRIPHVRIAEARAASGAPSWMYLFTWSSPVQDGLFGSAHGFDVPFVFHTFQADGVLEWMGGDLPQSLADHMQDAWIQFAHTGNPNGPGLPAWPVYEPNDRATMLLDVESRLAADPAGEDREAWEGIAFDGETPAIF